MWFWQNFTLNLNIVGQNFINSIALNSNIFCGVLRLRKECTRFDFISRSLLPPHSGISPQQFPHFIFQTKYCCSVFFSDHKVPNKAGGGRHHLAETSCLFQQKSLKFFLVVDTQSLFEKGILVCRQSRRKCLPEVTVLDNNYILIAEEIGAFLESLFRNGMFFNDFVS